MRPLRPATLLVSVCLSVALSPRAARAHEGALFDSPRLVNLDTALLVPEGHWYLSAGLRAFEKPEDLTYGDVEVRRGISRDWEVGLAYGFAGQRDYDTGRVILRHGGTSLDLRAKYSLKRSSRAAVAAILGVEFPNTPSRDEPQVRLEVPVSWAPGPDLTIHSGPRLVFLPDNTLFSLGIGFEARLSEHVRLLGEWSPIWGGDNTRDEIGQLTDDDIWAAALRFIPGDTDEVTMDLGVTNALGQPGSLSLAPGILDSAAFYWSVNWLP